MSMNRMTSLLNKIERRLGTKPLGLPDHLAKPIWATDVIEQDTLDTFSRFFPHAIPYILTPDRRKGDCWLIDENICDSIEIIGCGDIDWHAFSTTNPSGMTCGGMYSPMDMLTSDYDVEDIMMQQQLADHTSIFKTSIYPEFFEPNMIKMHSIVSNNNLNVLQNIPIRLFVKHSNNLMTIPAMKMELFEELAISDVAGFLYENLKNYTIDTVYANIDIKIDELKDKANDREKYLEELKEGFVSFANHYQPMVIAM